MSQTLEARHGSQQEKEFPLKKPLRRSVRKKPRILLADDQEIVLQAVSNLLDTDFEVVGSARDGVSFLEMAERIKFDACVVDISMPGMSGVEASRRLLRHDPKARIVFLTVHEDPIYREEALSLGGLGYVLKGSLAQDLVPTLRSVLARRR
jgi:DNA-binding NarL/FixJ family response regulator